MKDTSKTKALLIQELEDSRRLILELGSSSSMREGGRDVPEESSTILRSLLAATPAGVALLKDRSFIKVNTALCRITGYSEEEMTGMSTRILYPDEGEFLRIGRDLYEKMEQDGLGVADALLQRKDGSIFNVQLSLSPFDPGNLSAGVCATVLDITGRKRPRRRSGIRGKIPHPGGERSEVISWPRTA
jgi:PAS domain S-box-containing protein